MKTVQLPEYVQKICNLMKSVSEVFPDALAGTNSISH